eukprot:11925884-Heterocapsa_arctica.AAC.1
MTILLRIPEGQDALLRSVAALEIPSPATGAQGSQLAAGTFGAAGGDLAAGVFGPSRGPSKAPHRGHAAEFQAARAQFGCGALEGLGAQVGQEDRTAARAAAADIGAGVRLGRSLEEELSDPMPNGSSNIFNRMERAQALMAQLLAERSGGMNSVILGGAESGSTGTGLRGAALVMRHRANFTRDPESRWVMLNEKIRERLNWEEGENWSAEALLSTTPWGHNLVLKRQYTRGARCTEPCAATTWP